MTTEIRADNGPTTRWTGRDWAIILVSAFVFGFVYLSWDYVYQFLLMRLHLNLAVTSLINGMWFLGGLIPMALIRKPGACLVGETLAALWEVTLVYILVNGDYPIKYSGETYTTFLMDLPGQGIREFRVFNVVFFVGILEGLGPEMIFALTRYRDWSWRTWVYAGSAGAILEWMTGIWVTHYYAIEPAHIFWGILVTSIIGIGLLAGSLSWAISRRHFTPAAAPAAQE
ncbi:MAG: ECF transporter S component [Armatimonadetes bacterium]|nr:ECF transporter S component [Armatimonadota bacterium]